MRQFILIVFFSVGGLLSFIWYWASLIHWIQGFRSGFYPHNNSGTILETAFLVLYTYLGVRFLKNRIMF